MKFKKFVIPIYDFTVILIEVESKEDAELVGKKLKGLIDKDMIAEEVETIKLDKHDGGNTYRNFKTQTFVILMYRMTSEKERLNTLGHEKRHVEDRLAEHTALDGIESMAYLAGYLTMKLFL